MSKRGLSMEEKCDRAFDYIRTRGEFFHIKELEKALPKAKGITPMAIKDVIQSLVDDDRINSEKVGSSSYYWIFESQLRNTLETRNALLDKELEALTTELDTVETKLTIYTEDTDTPDPERVKELLSELKSVEKDQLELSTQLKSYENTSPEFIEQMEKDQKRCLDGANRWTDNIWNVESWIKKRFPGFDAQKMFNIPDDLDYVN